MSKDGALLNSYCLFYIKSSTKPPISCSIINAVTLETWRIRVDRAGLPGYNPQDGLSEAFWLLLKAQNTKNKTMFAQVPLVKPDLRRRI